MRRIVWLTVSVLLFATGGVWAQDEDEPVGRDVFAPFVSRLRVAVRDPQVRLTWRDSEDFAAGSYQVYRHTSEITRDSLDDATLIGSVEPGVETYLDTPLEEGSYYYAVLASEPDGRVYPIFVPFRNKTLRPVQVTRLESEEDMAASVYDIEAMVQESAVVLRFTPSRTGRTLAVYRSTVPFASVTAVNDATLLDEIDSANRRFSDYPVPGVDYYYGVFDSALIERGSVSIEDGENVLSEPIRIALSSAPGITIEVPEPSKRRAPLPLLQLATGIQSGRRLAEPDVPAPGTARPLPVSAEQAINALLDQSAVDVAFQPEPRILPEERVAEGEGVSLTLFRIVNGEFSDGDYDVSVRLLRNLLDLPMSTPVERRVRFYLGQALFFDQRMEPAFMEFLLAGDGELYEETRPWIGGILTRRS